MEILKRFKWSFMLVFVFGGKGEFEHVEDLIQFETQNVSILLLIDTKLNLLYCVNNIFIIDESFHLNYFF